MVDFCYKLIYINLLYCYMLRRPYIKFIHILINLNKMYKKILCLINLFMRRVNQQETFFLLISNTIPQFSLVQPSWTRYTYLSIEKDSSETICNLIYNFNDYLNSKPVHKKKINYQFLEWFIGFTEGDGSFVISKNKVYFDITQSLKDVQILYYIKKELGFGKVLIRSEKQRNVGVFYVTSEENFLRLINIFNGNLSSNYKKEQFKNWLNVFNNQYKKNILFKDRLVLPSLSTRWLTGFIDAEGCFTGRVKKCKSYKLRRGPHLTFSISQKELYILKEIREILINDNIIGLKNINFDKSWEGWVLHISSFTKLKIVRNYLSKYKLKTKKYLAYKKWCLIHDMVLNKNHLTLEGLEKIDFLTKKINDYNYKLNI